MADFNDYEYSTQLGEPIEFYRLKFLDVEYRFTSSSNDIVVTNDSGLQETFFSEYIKRSELVPGTADSSSQTCTLYLKRNSAIGMLFQGSPPEKKIEVIVMRSHSEDINKFVTILKAHVSQVTYRNSETDVLLTIDDYMNNTIPKGNLQYYCNNTLFDKNCKLSPATYKKTFNANIEIESTYIRSVQLGNYPDGTFDGGYMEMGKMFRYVSKHVGDTIWFKYPLNKNLTEYSFTLYPGCDGLFSTCATKFGNTDHFTGVPYTPPTDPTVNPTGKGTYWIDSLVITRDSHGFVGTITGI